MGTLLTKVFQRAAGWWKAADPALQTILPELTTESVPSRLVRFTPVNVLPVYFSALNEPENDGIERLFLQQKEWYRRSFASVSLTETGAFLFFRFLLRGAVKIYTYNQSILKRL